MGLTHCRRALEGVSCLDPKSYQTAGEPGPSGIRRDCVTTSCESDLHLFPDIQEVCLFSTYFTDGFDKLVSPESQPTAFRLRLILAVPRS